MKTLHLASFLFLPSSLAWVVPRPGCLLSVDGRFPPSFGTTTTAGGGAGRRRVSSILAPAPRSILPSSSIHERSLNANHDSHEISLPSQQRRLFLTTVVGSFATASLSSSWLLVLAPHATMAATTTTTTPSSATPSPDDLLNQFGLGLSSSSSSSSSTPNPSTPRHQSSSKWPESPSPLPTNKRSAQELTRETENSTNLVVPPEVAVGKEESDLQRALFQSGQRKPIDPRTHG